MNTQTKAVTLVINFSLLQRQSFTCQLALLVIP